MSLARVISFLQWALVSVLWAVLHLGVQLQHPHLTAIAAAFVMVITFCYITLALHYDEHLEFNQALLALFLTAIQLVNAMFLVLTLWKHGGHPIDASFENWNFVLVGIGSCVAGIVFPVATRSLGQHFDHGLI